MGTKVLNDLLQGCLIKDRASQKLLYQNYYAFSMGICLRYSSGRDEAIQQLNDGFILIFEQLSLYEDTIPFDQWLKTILIGIFIGQSRKGLHQIDFSNTDPPKSTHHSIFSPPISYQDLLTILQRIPQTLRTFFNLHAIDSYTFEQLSNLFMISDEHSRAIVTEARIRLAQHLSKTAPLPLFLINNS